MKFDNKYFINFKFTKEQIRRNFENALKDLKIARKVEIKEVKFNYSYTSFIKLGIALLSFYNIKAKSMPGHHIKIIEQMAILINDDSIMTVGNLMRSKRNLDFYAGGVDITEKECAEFIKFIETVLSRVKAIVFLG